MAKDDAVLQGGPREGTTFAAGNAALLELEIDGMVHRYIRTKHQRESTEGAMAVFTYDGMVNPGGAQDGAEHARDRMASPTAEELRSDQRDNGEDMT